MNKYIWLITVILLIQNLNAQDKYLVSFRDKKGSRFNPYTYFDQKAIDRRLKNGISLYDSSDYPLNQDYVALTKSIVSESGIQSRWLNALVVKATPEEIVQVQSFPFVQETELLEPCNKVISGDEEIPDTSFDKNLLKDQSTSLEGELFADQGISGKGVRIAIFDVGFKNVDTHPAFQHIRDAGHIIKTWDFINENEFVYDYGTHGRAVLSCIAGKAGNLPIGLAPDAEFLLARTEYAKKEVLSEEENWLAAAEWADKNGADIINSSLGYTGKRYFTYQMDGKTALVSRAATYAARKGILVVNAMGNEGSNSWNYVSAPADADSVLSIGGLKEYTHFHIAFSSFGPTADFRRKPNVSALGHAVTAGGGTRFAAAFGTSFSTPLVAGFAACVKQLHPGWNNMQLFKAIEESGELYPYFDYAHGYGLPRASYFIGVDTTERVKAFTIKKQLDRISVEVLISGENKDEQYLYYRIQKPNGVLRSYEVLKFTKTGRFEIPLSKYQKGDRLSIWYMKDYQKINL